MEETKVKKSRTKNPVTPLDRVLEAISKETLRSDYNIELSRSVEFQQQIFLDDIASITDPVFERVKNRTKSVVTCRVKSLTNLDEYPTKKYRLDTVNHMNKLVARFGEAQRIHSNDSVPFDLHRASALEAADWDLSKADMVAIHRCHTKACFAPDHVYFGTIDQNKSTDYCPLYVNLNGGLLNICHHSPSCLLPGPKAQTWL